MKKMGIIVRLDKRNSNDEGKGGENGRDYYLRLSGITPEKLRRAMNAVGEDGSLFVFWDDTKDIEDLSKAAEACPDLFDIPSVLLYGADRSEEHKERALKNHRRLLENKGFHICVEGSMAASRLE